MRHIKRAKPVLGDRRVRTKFLWFPVTIGYETRWLERATIAYEYRYYFAAYPDCRIPCKTYWWRPERFINT